MDDEKGTLGGVSLFVWRQTREWKSARSAGGAKGKLELGRTRRRVALSAEEVRRLMIEVQRMDRRHEAVGAGTDDCHRLFADSSGQRTGKRMLEEAENLVSVPR